MTDGLLQLGAVAVIFLVAIREFFAYLKARKNGNGNGEMASIKKELVNIKENHLSHIHEKITELNTKVNIIMKHLGL